MADERLRHRAYTREHGERPAESPTGAGRADSEPRRRSCGSAAWYRRVRMLVVNAGSSSLKLRVLGDGDADATLAQRELAAPDGAGRSPSSCARAALAAGRRRRGRPPDRPRRRALPRAGPDRRRGRATRCAQLTDLAPLHQPKSLARARRRPPSCCRTLPAVACFDTAFHATLPPAAATYALPADGASAGRCAASASTASPTRTSPRRAPELLGRGPPTGCASSAATSAPAPRCAPSRDGRSVDTTMGFTPLEGLVMATRSGSVDPGLLLWLRGARAARRRRSSRDALEHRSGLLGARRQRRHARDPRRAPARGEPRASLALDVYVHRLRAGIAAMAAALGGLDVLVFTGGVGEHARARARARRRGARLPRRRARSRAQRAHARRTARSARDGARRPHARDHRARGPRDRPQVTSLLG